MKLRGVALFTSTFIIAAIGCGTKIRTIGGEGGGNPEGCPANEPSVSSSCADGGLICQYDVGPCVSSYLCDDSLTWQKGASSCPNQFVPCELASQGDACQFVGESCGFGDECGGTTTSCDDNHQWQVSYYEDDCCYDDCCYEDCCEPYECPREPPIDGASCDPCWDSDSCVWQLDLGCGLQSVYAGCSWDSYTWEVEASGCGGGGAGGAGAGGSGSGGDSSSSGVGGA